MSLEYLLISFSLLVVLWGYGFAVGLFYGKAMLHGIAAARDLNHRVTPQSPWFYFDGEFKPRMRRFAIGMGIFLLGWTIFTAIPTFAISGWDIPAILLPPFAFLGLTGFILAGVTWWAPRVNNLAALAALGSLHGTILEMLKGVMRFTFGGNWTLFILIMGVGAYIFAWRHVRRKLNREWFRFDE